MTFKVVSTMSIFGMYLLLFLWGSLLSIVGFFPSILAGDLYVYGEFCFNFPKAPQLFFT